jgi:hypothetical protein
MMLCALLLFQQGKDIPTRQLWLPMYQACDCQSLQGTVCLWIYARPSVTDVAFSMPASRRKNITSRPGRHSGAQLNMSKSEVLTIEVVWQVPGADPGEDAR